MPAGHRARHQRAVADIHLVPSWNYRTRERGVPRPPDGRKSGPLSDRLVEGVLCRVRFGALAGQHRARRAVSSAPPGSWSVQAAMADESVGRMKTMTLWSPGWWYGYGRCPM